MTRRWSPGGSLLFAWLMALAMSPGVACATQVWSGRTRAFSKAPQSDPTDPLNQDRITPPVWITRGASQGIYNIRLEPGFTRATSPAETEWADGDAVDHASLSFQPWVDWAQDAPLSTLGRNAVVHLITEDIYVDIVFDSWGTGAAGAGAFSYHRAVQAATPTERRTWARIKGLYR